MMREGIYSDNKSHFPAYIKDELGAWLIYGGDWEVYFYREEGCWTLNLERKHLKEIIIDKDLFKW